MTSAADANAPFGRILIPYDGSEPADAALEYALAFGRSGSHLDLLHVVDQTAAISPATSSMIAFDPGPLLDALEAEGNALLQAAAERCRRAGVEPAVTLAHELPVTAILAAAQRDHADLIVLGTHGRSGLSRMFIGSVTEGVLRAGTAAVLAVNPPVRPESHAPFHKLLVAVDDSDPANAAAALAGRMARAYGAVCVFAHIVDTADVHSKATSAGQPSLIAALQAQGEKIIARARRAAGLSEENSCQTVVEQEPVKGILLEAERAGADAIVVGSHGRRGLRRMFLGSVAEEVMRRSPLPVFVVRTCLPAQVKAPDMRTERLTAVTVLK